MNRKQEKRPHGQLRQSQLVTTFGPGSMIDLPNHSVLVAGLDFWTRHGDAIVEKRLADKICKLLGWNEVEFYAPPPEPDDTDGPQTGVRVWQFPQWFIVQDAQPDELLPGTRSRLIVHSDALTKGKFIDRNRKRRNVVPVRFVRACRKGHISDINWYEFVHGSNSDCRRQLWIDERGTSGDIRDIVIRCDCRQSRPLTDATVYVSGALGFCNGERPWLGPHSREPGCGEGNRLLIRTASNAYFSQTLSVISLPDRSDALKATVDRAWDFLEAVESLEDLVHERKKSKVKMALEGYTDEEVFAAVQSRKIGWEQEGKGVKQAELETLVASQDEIGEDKPNSTFLARCWPKERWDRPWMKSIERVVLVHRLREVVAQVGFTRFEAAAADIQGELEIDVKRAALAKEATWLPAIENRGEGFFLQFRKADIEAWASRPDVQARGKRLLAGFESWQGEHSSRSGRDFFGLPYILLHSLSHLLITAVSLECGYPASSIRERIYALPDIGYGILLYTGTTDAEGTLGGLVEVGRRIHEHVRTALEIGDLCSNDPVCAEHDPVNEHERRFLHGAACHGCLLIAETSCEQHNDFLDRALVVKTVQNLGVEFFPDELL